MDKNTIAGLVVIGLIVILYSVFFMPEQEPQKTTDSTQTTEDVEPAKIEQDSVEKQVDIPLQDSSQVDSIDPSIKARYCLFQPPKQEVEQLIILENNNIRVTLSSHGGHIHSVELINYRTHDSLPLILLDPENNEHSFELPLDLNPGNCVVSTGDLFFETEGKSAVVENNDSASVSFRIYIDKDRWFENKFTIHGDSYQLDYDMTMNNLDQIIPTHSYYTMRWRVKPRKQERDMKQERRLTTLYYKYFNNTDVDRLSVTKDDEERSNDRIHWVGFRQQFFIAALISKEGFDEGVFSGTVLEDSVFIKSFNSRLILSPKKQREETHHFLYVFSTNHYQTLKNTGYQLNEMVPLGWGIFGWVNKFFIMPIFNWLSKSISSYGLIILILTVFIKLILTPLTYRSYTSMAKMNLLKPEIDELKKKYNNDMKKVSPEQLKLFQKAGVNPLGGCIPMLLQMPILIAMYRFFPASIELRQESFLWATDLSTYDSIYDFPGGFEIPFYGDHISLFTLLMTASTFLYTYINNQMAAQTNPQMKIMMYFMPIMLLGFFNNFSSALTYYYFLFNIFGFAQQWILKKFFINEDRLRAKIAAKKGKTKKKSGFQKRLEEMARKRQLEARKRK